MHFTERKVAGEAALRAYRDLVAPQKREVWQFRSQAVIRAQFRASGRAGALVFAEPARLAAWLAVAKDQPLQVTLERESSRRGAAQNARYWAGIVPFLCEIFEQRAGIPFTPEMGHHAAKLAFLGHIEVMIGGEVILVPKSTTMLSKEQFSRYCDAIEAWIETEFQVKPELLQAARA